MKRVKEAARRHFKYVEVRDVLLANDFFYDKGFNSCRWAECEWCGGEWFLDEYFRGLAVFGNEIYLSFPSDTSFAYWCEGARYRPKSLDNGNFFFIKEHIDAVANMASNMLDGGVGVVTGGPFEIVRFQQLWNEPFEPDGVAKWIEAIKGKFKGWRDLRRLVPEYTFDGWNISAWVENVTDGAV